MLTSLSFVNDPQLFGHSLMKWGAESAAYSEENLNWYAPGDGSLYEVRPGTFGYRFSSIKFPFEKQIVDGVERFVRRIAAKVFAVVCGSIGLSTKVLHQSVRPSSLFARVSQLWNDHSLYGDFFTSLPSQERFYRPFRTLYVVRDGRELQGREGVREQRREITLFGKLLYSMSHFSQELEDCYETLEISSPHVFKWCLFRAFKIPALFISPFGLLPKVIHSSFRSISSGKTGVDCAETEMIEA